MNSGINGTLPGCPLLKNDSRIFSAGGACIEEQGNIQAPRTCGYPFYRETHAVVEAANYEVLDMNAQGEGEKRIGDRAQILQCPKRVHGIQTCTQRRTTYAADHICQIEGLLRFVIFYNNSDPSFFIFGKYEAKLPFCNKQASLALPDNHGAYESGAQITRDFQGPHKVPRIGSSRPQFQLNVGTFRLLEKLAKLPGFIRKADVVANLNRMYAKIPGFRHKIESIERVSGGRIPRNARRPGKGVRADPQPHRCSSRSLMPQSVPRDGAVNKMFFYYPLREMKF